jgi:hypothetical protein
MSDEHNVSSQSSMQCLPTWLPIIILRRVEEQLSVVREVMVRAVFLCADKRIILSILGICMAQRIKCFLVILCNLSFSVVSDFEADFLYL